MRKAERTAPILTKTSRLLIINLVATIAVFILTYTQLKNIREELILCASAVYNIIAVICLTVNKDSIPSVYWLFTSSSLLALSCFIAGLNCAPYIVVCGFFLCLIISYQHTHIKIQSIIAGLITLGLIVLSHLFEFTKKNTLLIDILLGAILLTCYFIVAYTTLVSEHDVYASLITKERNKANHDKLTGLLNRVSLTSFVDAVTSKTGVTSLIMMDIDNFKKVNDTYGHTEGDRILKDLASAIQKSIRDTDKAFRYGGEEFCVICPQTEVLNAKAVAERIRKTFNEKAYEYNGETVHFSVSLGVSECRYGEYQGLNQFVEKSDSALYEAKHNGKNRVETYKEDLSDSIGAQKLV